MVNPNPRASRALATAVLATLCVLGGCASTPAHRSSGEFIDDANVKASIQYILK